MLKLIYEKGRYPLLLPPLTQAAKNRMKNLWGMVEKRLTRYEIPFRHEARFKTCEHLNLLYKIFRGNNAASGDCNHKAGYRGVVKRLIPNFEHIETGKNLDEKV